jgi:hypothetical protein
MEKNIASHDLSDMLVYDNLDARSKKFTIKHTFEPVRKLIDHSFSALESLGKSCRRAFTAPRQTVRKNEDLVFTDTAAAVYSIIVASTLLSFFWLSLLIAT